MEERATSKILVVALIIYDFSKSFAGIQYLQHGSIRSMCPTHYKKALKNGGNRPQILDRMAEVYELMGNSNKAEEIRESMK